MNEEQLQEGRGSGLFTLKNLILLLIGIVLGYFLKLQALQTVTIGYDDYKLSQWNQSLVGQKIKSDDHVSSQETNSSVNSAPVENEKNGEINFNGESEQTETKGQPLEEKEETKENK